MEKRQRVFFCDISEFRICAQSRGADPDAVVFQRTGFSAFSFVVADRTEQKEDGQVTACYLIFYSIGRFVIEFFRGDIIRGSVGILSTSQFISIFTGIAGIVLLIRIRKKETVRAVFKRIREFPCIRKKLDNSGIRTGFRCIHL